TLSAPARSRQELWELLKVLSESEKNSVGKGILPVLQRQAIPPQAGLSLPVNMRLDIWVQISQGPSRGLDLSEQITRLRSVISSCLPGCVADPAWLLPYR